MLRLFPLRKSKNTRLHRTPGRFSVQLQGGFVAEEDSQATSAQPYKACHAVVRHQQAKVTKEIFLPRHLKTDTSQVFCFEKLKTSGLTVFVRESPATLKNEKQIDMFSPSDFPLGWLMEFICSLNFSSNCMIYLSQKRRKKNLFDLEQQVGKVSTQAL